MAEAPTTRRVALGLVDIRLYGCTRKRIPRRRKFLGGVVGDAWQRMTRFDDVERRLDLEVGTGIWSKADRKPRAHTVGLNRRYGTWRRRFGRVIPVTGEQALILERKGELNGIGIQQGS